MNFTYSSFVEKKYQYVLDENMAFVWNIVHVIKWATPWENAIYKLYAWRAKAQMILWAFKG